MMRDCHQCGEPNQQTARFCVVCGAPLVGAAPQASRPPGEARAPLPPPPVVSHVPPVGSGLPPPPPVGGGGLPPPPAVPAAGKLPINRPPSGSHEPVGGVRLLDVPVDAPRVLVGFLVSFDNLELGQYWPIHQGRNVVGRQGATSNVQIEIAHPTTSSVHAVLLAVARPGRVLVEDNHSTNGTFVNDNPLAAGQRWELRDGDRVRFGLFNTVIKVLESTYPIPGAPAAPG